MISNINHFPRVGSMAYTIVFPARCGSSEASSVNVCLDVGDPSSSSLVTFVCALATRDRAVMAF